MRLVGPSSDPTDLVDRQFTISQSTAHEHLDKITRLVHNGTAYPARPAILAPVEYVGPTMPTDMEEGDSWTNTSAFADAVARAIHDGTNYPPRPGATYVEWIGPTLPAGAIAGDTWINTA